jgi:3',5'-cyclic AMP phosphodiesterase CpdA
MTSIRILHASDLHIAVPDQRRSFKDSVKDAIFSLPRHSPKATWKALRKMSIASSYEPRALKHLAEFIVHNAKGVKPDVMQYTEETAAQHSLELLKEKLDAIVITGDLATTGLDEDLKRVKLFLSEPYDSDVPHKPIDRRTIVATLSALDQTRTPVAFLPGNHDRYWFHWKVPTYMPGHPAFDLLLSNYSSQPVQTTPVTAEHNALRVVILAADFTLSRFRDHEGPFGWIAQGKVYEDANNDILGDLVGKTLSEIETCPANVPLCILWAVHFPPDFKGQSGQHKLINGSRLLEEADRLHVNGILAGHTHYQRKYRNENSATCPVFCCGTTTQHEPKTSIKNPTPQRYRENLFQILTISADEAGKIRIDSEDYYHPPAKALRPRVRTHWQKVTLPKR